MFKYLRYIPVFIFIFMPAVFCAAQGLSLDEGVKRSQFNFTRENYVSPEEYQESLGEQIDEEDSSDGKTDPNGPWMICQIAADGLVNINKKTITKNISAKEGSLYYKSAIQDDVAALMALGNFDNMEISIEQSSGERKDKEDKQLYPCHTLTVILKEKPILEKINYTGRKALSKSAIQNAMATKIKDPFSRAKLEADMEKIEGAYAAKGYVNTKASFDFSLDEKTNTVTVNINLDEGSRTRVKEVIVEGLNDIPAKKFIKQLSNRPKKIFKAQNIPQDHYKAITYARNLGYFDFKIDDYSPEFNEDKSEVVLKYKVTEGHDVIFGDTTFEGNNVYTTPELEKVVFYKKGKRFNQQKFDITVRDLQEKYANKGYLRADITPQKNLDEENGVLNINFDILENNRVYIDHIDITGNEQTKTYVFARELTIKEGEIFNYEKVRRSQNKLMNLGFLNDAQIDITPTNDISKVDVAYNVVEGRPGMFTAGIAMSSLDGLYGDVSLNHLNLFGKAQRLSLRALFGSRILDYTVSWSTPWIGEKPISFGVDAFNTRRYRSYRSTSSAYTEKRQGGRLNLGPRFNDDMYLLSFSYTFENIHIYDIDEQYQSELEDGTTNVSTLGATFAIDTRDNVWDATSGSRNSIGIDLSGGPMFGDLDIYRLTLKSSYNKTLINIGNDYPIVLMIGNRAGIVKPYGRTDEVPAYERVFLGGADTVRGYDTTGQIGPATGGELYYIGNVELKFPLAREGRRTIAQFAAFFDIGNSWMDFSDVKFQTGTKEDQFKMGVGLGLRLVTPSLPIRIDWGYGLNHQPGEKRGYIYFSMANLF